MDDGSKQGWKLEDGGFLALILFITLAFAWLIAPFYSAILWGLIAAIVGEPVYRRLAARFGGRRNLAATLTLLLILALVIVPAILIGISLVQEAASIYIKLESGEIDLARIFQQLRDALPPWAHELAGTSGMSDLQTAREMLGSSIATGLQSIASRALIFSQGALNFIASLGAMLYLTFFLLRDGENLGEQIKAAVPLRPDLRDALVHHFVVVIRATMKGTIVIAILQGSVGGLIFWLLGIDGALLWGLMMAAFSLIPAVGTGIVWAPVAIYLLVTGAIWEGVTLAFCGFFVIGLIDNLLRPVLVGHDARMPEFVVLITTIAGLKLMGLNGVIVGPVIAALFIAVWKIATEWREQQKV